MVPIRSICREIGLVRVPGDRFGKTAAKTFPPTIGRDPPEPFTGLVNICKQTLHLASRWADAALIVFDLNGHTHQFGDGACSIAYRNFKAAANVNDLAKNSISNRRSREAPHGICNKREIACWMQRP